MGMAYLAARDAGRTADGSATAAGHRVEDQSAALLAAIVRRDVTMLRAHDNPGVEAYFRHTGMTVLTMAASCNFGPGVEYLLAKGVDPNAGVDNGAFNMALVYGNSAMAADLLRHSYRIDASSKRCRSSKYIVVHSDKTIDAALRSRVEDAVCPVAAAPASGSLPAR